ncbi:MAG TPA: hypothetical protein VNG93_00040 [Candidatus Dormibacteraeota bacterium]|nr:hypothetical protein [Candidatus Dormibacteraeota bacterium]
MKDDIRRAFDGITEAPHPALRASLRARLRAGQAEDPPRAWRLVVGSVLAAGVVALVLVVAVGLQPQGREGPAPVATAAATPSALPTATPTPAIAAVSPTPSPTSASLACSSPQTFSGGTPGVASVTQVRVGTTAAYDRFVIQFDGPVPTYTVTPQGSATFMQDPTGQTLQLRGADGVKIVVRGASATTPSGSPAYAGPMDLTPGYSSLQEARQLGDFERVYSWGLGISQPACLRVSVFTGPARLVVDVLKH